MYSILMSGFGEQKNDILFMQGICAGDLNGQNRHGFSIMNLKLHKTIKNSFGWHKWQKTIINQSLHVSKNVISCSVIDCSEYESMFCAEKSFIEIKNKKNGQETKQIQSIMIHVLL